jgi:ethanolamine utilization microcompartment shell protein EutL
MKNFEISISGNSQSEIENALREVLRLIEAGFCHGMNSNEDGEFSFSSDGQYEFD